MSFTRGAVWFVELPGAGDKPVLIVSWQPIQKAHHAVRIGDVLTFPQGGHIRVVRVAQLGVRRGPAGEARLLYEDLAPPVPAPAGVPQGERASGTGRPTKADRRAIDRLHDM